MLSRNVGKRYHYSLCNISEEQFSSTSREKLEIAQKVEVYQK